LKVLTKFSAAPFDEGLYGAVLMSKNTIAPLFLRNVSNSTEHKEVPLSDTNFAGIPQVAKYYLNTITVELDFIFNILFTKTHFEYASKITMNIIPLTGPKKSKWILCAGPSGQDQLCNTLLGGLSLRIKHSLHSFVIHSISESIPGHHI